MADKFLDITIDASEVDRLISAVKTSLHSDSQRMFLRQIAYPWFATRAAARFASGGDDASGKWAPLRPATERLRAWQIGGGMRGSVATGIMPRGIRGAGLTGVKRDKPINVRTGSLRAFVLGSYQIEQFGEGATLQMPARNAPKLLMRKFERAQRGGIAVLPINNRLKRFSPRPVLAVGQADAAAMDDLAGDWFMEMIRAHA